MWDLFQNDPVAEVGAGIELKHDWPWVLETSGAVYITLFSLVLHVL